MKIVIIEDEKLTAKDLEHVILEVAPESEVVQILYSVKQALEYFEQHPTPDLIFSDIQLGDGLSFEIFEQISIPTPVIFCTAYDEFALEAFRQNSIDYVLKPFSKEAIQSALDKYTSLSEVFSKPTAGMNELRDIIQQMQPARSSSILVHHREKIIPIKMENIGVFYIENKGTYLQTMDGQTYFINKTLDELEQAGGSSFFRANRQFLINRQAVGEASHHLSRKFSVHLNIPFEHSITISKEKLSDFLGWLAK